MKKNFLLLSIIILLFSCNSAEHSDDPVNGIMIDCARLLEQHDYYYRLVDFMADWDMNTLVLHFSDDHGLSVRLPGFEKLARDRAFTPEEIRELISYAAEKGIDVIPELEVFGHTRYITDHPDYRHLYIGEWSEELSFNAIDPLHPGTIMLMHGMISAVADLFPSNFLHIGCDEVNLAPLNLEDGTEEAQVWTEYVNTMIDIVHEQGKTPVIWNDHLNKNENIARMLRKDVVLMEWNYDPEYRPVNLENLRDLGYENIIMAPSLTCYRLRVLPSRPALMNTEAHAAAVRSGEAIGLVNTIWLPMRYLQDAMWYGIAYSAYLVNSGEPMDTAAFHRKFAKKVFGKRLSPGLNDYLKKWPQLHLHRRYYISLAQGKADHSGDPEAMRELREVYRLSEELLSKEPDYPSRRNKEILASMYLATRVMNVLSEGLLIAGGDERVKENKREWRQELGDVIEKVEREWDRGRFADDPAKHTPKFPNLEHSHLLIMLKRLDKEV
ncbi:MAG: family 20 glycosylhydrolase [Fidelibacterota bacterium]